MGCFEGIFEPWCNKILKYANCFGEPVPFRFLSQQRGAHGDRRAHLGQPFACAINCAKAGTVYEHFSVHDVIDVRASHEKLILEA